MAQRRASSSSGGGLERDARAEDDEEGRAKPRATIFTAHHETLEVTTERRPADVEIPAGFKQKK